MDKLNETLPNDEWYQKADAEFNARMADYSSFGQNGGYNNYVMEARKYKSNMDPLQTMGYLHAQETIDSNWDYFKNLSKSAYNGGVGVFRDTLNGIRAARDYNIKILNEQAKAQGIERNPDQRFIDAMDDAVKVQALQPYDIKPSSSTLGQFGLDLAQGAGQLAGQAVGSVVAESVLPGVGGLALMVGQITGSQYEDLKAKGVDPQRAAEAAFANAMIQAPFERLSLARLMRKVPAGSVFKKKMKMVWEDMATEGITEFIQQFPEEWAETWATNPNKSWKELREKAAEKFPDTLQNAMYAGLIGAVLGAGARGIHIAMDKDVDLELRREVHKEQLDGLERRITNIKESGIDPNYAGETINANLNNTTVMVDGDTLYAFAQKVGAEEVAEKLGVTVDAIERAADDGDVVEIAQGNFEAMSASSPGFFEAMKDSLTFDEQDISNRKQEILQKNIERYTKLAEDQRKELNDEVNKIASTMEEAGMEKKVVDEWKNIFTAFALNARPDNPIQFLRDNALRFERGMEQPNALNQIVIDDAAYFDAIDRGDMETVQRMVDEVAELSGMRKTVRGDAGVLGQTPEGTKSGIVKGSFDPFTNGEAIIKLFNGADASTVIHETGHYYIESLWREIMNGNATEQQKADFEKLMNYCGITTEKWAGMSLKGREAAHERLAEAIETYIMEDKAPTRELRPVFKRFAKWLKSVYSAISRNKNAVPLTDEVREVFDRMLASEEDVEEMKRVEGYFAKLPSTITDNLSDATKRRIEDYIVKAQDKAVEILTKERLANFREERQKEIEKYREKIADSVKEEVANQPLYVAARRVQEVLGGEKSAPAKSYARQYLDNKMAPERIVEWSIIAETYGFQPGELASKLVDEPNENEAYREAINKAVNEKFPDYYTEREQAEEATRMSMYNDEAGILLGVEQVLIEDFAVKQKAKQRSAEASRKLAMAKRQQATVAAKNELANKKLKDAIRVDRFINAERRCAVKSAEAMAKKDYETARKYKDMQAFNHACVIESAAMRKKWEQNQKYLRRQIRSKKETWTNDQHFDQAAALFARMGYPRRDYYPETRTQTLSDYLAEMSDEFYAFDEIPGWLSDDMWPITRSMEMTLDDYQKVIDLVRYIKTMARLEKGINTFNSDKSYGEWKENALDELNKLETKFVPVLGEQQQPSLKERFDAAYQTLDNFLEKMDNWHYGFFSKSFGEAIKHANDNEFVHVEAYEKRLAEIEKEWCPDKATIEEKAKGVYYEELGTAANKFVLTKMLMNLGNEGNARKLCGTLPSEDLRNSSLWVFPNEGLTRDEAIAQTKENLLEFLGKVLTKEDIAYAQAKVDLQSMYWGEMVDMNRRTRGFAPPKVEAYPVTLQLTNGEIVVFRGGYFPLIRNGEMGSHPAGVMPVSETDPKQGKNIRTMHTDTGRTKARVDASYPVDLSEGSEDRAMRQAIHDLCWRETMTEFRRILNDPMMYGMMKTKLGPADMRAFREMLEHAAQPNGGASMAMGESLMAQTAGWLRRKTVNSIVMLNLRINLQNFGNFFLYGNSVEGFGYGDVISAMGNAMNNGFEGRSFMDMWAFVDEKSAFMRSRSETPDITLAQLREEGKLNEYERTAMEWGARAMMYTDGLTARPVWMQAYTKKINSGATEQEAIDFADTIIRRTLGSGRVTDVASLQRGTPTFKLFTAFQGFFNTQFNQWMREYNIDKRLWKEGNTNEAIKRITSFVASKYLAACLFNILLALENPFDDDDDKLNNLEKEILHYPMSLVGIFGPIANFMVDKTLGLRAYSYRMSIIESSLDKVYRAGGKMGKMIDGDFAEGVEGLTDVVGIGLGVPAQMNRLFWNAYDIFVNDMDPEWRDLATRRPKRERK